jgi:tetratricopeptide (TPR) repeat protein
VTRRAEYLAEAEAGIALCRRGQWEDGLLHLRRVHRAEETGVLKGDLPPLYYSYFGLGIAQYEKRLREGQQLCQRAAARAFFQPEAYLNLALVSMLAADRREAVAAIRKGLAIDPGNVRLQRLSERLGARQRPILRIFSRDNFLNRIFGRWRHRRLQKKAQG